jgi:hypothetical protein
MLHFLVKETKGKTAASIDNMFSMVKNNLIADALESSSSHSYPNQTVQKN